MVYFQGGSDSDPEEPDACAAALARGQQPWGVPGANAAAHPAEHGPDACAADLARGKEGLGATAFYSVER